MASLQRSATTFRRSGSSGLVWNERFFSGELPRPKNREVGVALESSEPLSRNKGVGAARAATRGGGIRISTAARNGGRYQGQVAATDPPSPKVPACLCYGFTMGKHDSNKRPNKKRRI
ncbi:MAPK kinase substrate protein At1g80180-like [Curcuma longa]|uniref:MAPK kinase substrate protein At1g80180-like n=1 Tax=Curcuma longa TaxID=136217 RepID=UPI003D9F3B39